MEKLVRFPLADGDCVVVQLDGGAIGGPTPAANKPGVIEDAQHGFESAAAKLRPIARVMLDQIKDLGCDEIKLELSVRFCAEAGLILAKTATEGHCRLGLMWKPRRPGTP